MENDDNTDVNNYLQNQSDTFLERQTLLTQYNLVLSQYKQVFANYMFNLNASKDIKNTSNYFVLGITNDNLVKQINNLSSGSWTDYNAPQMRSVSINYDNSLLGCGKDKQIYYATTSSGPWNAIKGPSVVGQTSGFLRVWMTQNGHILGLNQDNKMYFKDTLQGLDSWTGPMTKDVSGNPLLFSDFAVAPDETLLLLSKDTKNLYVQPYNHLLNTTTWNVYQIDTSATTLLSLVVAPTGECLAVNKKNNVVVLDLKNSTVSKNLKLVPTTYPSLSLPSTKIVSLAFPLSTSQDTSASKAKTELLLLDSLNEQLLILSQKLFSIPDNQNEYLYQYKKDKTHERYEGLLQDKIDIREKLNSLKTDKEKQNQSFLFVNRENYLYRVALAVLVLVIFSFLDIFLWKEKPKDTEGGQEEATITFFKKTFLFFKIFLICFILDIFQGLLGFSCICFLLLAFVIYVFFV